MLTITTHLVDEDLNKTRCGLPLPPSTSERALEPGMAVGLIVGEFTASCYPVGENDSNEGCVTCAHIRRGQLRAHRGRF